MSRSTKTYIGMSRILTASHSASLHSASTVVGLAVCQTRYHTTGDHHTYTPGPVAKGIRSVFAFLTPTSLKKRIALRLQAGLEHVEVLEREQAWVRKHGSPLAVMGLPEHAELAEVKTKYRDLVLDTHPDTQDGSQSSDANRNEYEILQTAYKMALNPDSIWHRNGEAPALLQEIRQTRITPVTKFAIFSYFVGAIVGCFIVGIVIYEMYVLLLRLWDPKLYAYMLQQEEIERTMLAAGETVDYDPKRLAPIQLKKAMYPGRYLHDEEERKLS